MGKPGLKQFGLSFFKMLLKHRETLRGILQHAETDIT